MKPDDQQLPNKRFKKICKRYTCRKPFATNRTWQKYCSTHCRIIDRKLLYAKQKQYKESEEKTLIELQLKMVQ